MHKLRILILYPDPAGLALLTSMLKSLGHTIEEAINDRAAVKIMERTDVDLVLAGVDPLDKEAMELLTYVRRKHREVPVILLFPRLHPERAKEALRLGAMAVLKYPVPAAELRAAVLQALEISGGRATDRSTAAHQTTSQQLSGMVHPSAPATVPALDFQPASSPGQRTVSATLPAPDAAIVNGVGAPATSAALFHRIEQLTREIGLMGMDPSWRHVLGLAATIAATRTSVLIVGEPGTGKSLLARLIHLASASSGGPLITVEAAAIDDELLTPISTDTNPSAIGTDNSHWANMLARANGGTLCIEEVAALPLELQLSLFRELHFRDCEASTGQSPSPAAARVIMSTGENLPALVEQGQFRQELYHRIRVISLMLPPLRHRGTDVELLAESFRAQYAREFHKAVTGFTREALDVLQRHDWPGNVRELEAAIQRAVVLCNGPRITSDNLSPILNRGHFARSTGGTSYSTDLKLGVRPLKEALEDPEKRIIIQALQAFNWNRQETARVLDINRTTLYKKMKKYNLLINEPLCTN